MKSYENSTTTPIHSEGTSKGRDERLADQGTPLGEAVEANKEKKLKGPNAPAT